MKALTATLAALVILAVFPVTAQAAITETANFSCTQIWNALGNTKPFVCLTENSDLTGDKLTFTGSSDQRNLGTQIHFLPDFCSPHVAPPDDWNDCISGVWARLGTSDSICLYRNDDLNNMMWRAVAPTSPAGATFAYSQNLHSLGWSDAASSVALQQSGQPCNANGLP